MPKTIEMIPRDTIDVQWWDELVERSEVQNPMIYSYALDLLAEEWCLVTNGKTWMPVPYDKRLGILRARQHPFSRQIDYIGEQPRPDFLNELGSFFGELSLGIGRIDRIPADQRYQALELSQDQNYSTNAKRLIKRSQSFTCTVSKNTEVLKLFYDQNTRQKMGLPESYSERLFQIMNRFLSEGKGFLLEASLNNEIRGSLFIILDKGTAYYLMADAAPEDKKEGVIFGLMDQAIDRSREMGASTFDFGGSNNKDVADFYKKFGAVDRFYSRIEENRTPFWYKLLKRVVR